MKRQRHQSGFSLLEVNMAIFVMAVGILSMVVLYPLGLRESTQGRADLKQAVFADFVLNQMVALVSQTNITWTQWQALKNVRNVANMTDLPFVGGLMQVSKAEVQYKISCCPVGGYSDKLLGIMVQSTEQSTGSNPYTNNPVYYAEALFQGDPAK